MGDDSSSEKGKNTVCFNFVHIIKCVNNGNNIPHTSNNYNNCNNYNNHNNNRSNRVGSIRDAPDFSG